MMLSGMRVAGAVRADAANVQQHAAMLRSLLRRSLCASLALSAACIAVASLGAQQTPQPVFTPDHPTGIYATGERVGWTVTLPNAVTKDARATGNYTYTIKRNGGELVSSGTLDLTSGRARIETSLAEPARALAEVQPPR